MDLNVSARAQSPAEFNISKTSNQQIEKPSIRIQVIENK